MANPRNRSHKTTSTPADAADASPNRDVPQPLGVAATLTNALDSTYRFAASLKLAVISLLALGAVLGYATFYERSYGMFAVQNRIYQSPWFALLLAFLGANILCAALIRYPWKKRQTGFVITHAGLLVILLGSWLSLNATLDGQVGLLEGESASEMIRQDHQAIWVQAIDASTGEPRESTAYKLPFQPGPFNWYEPGTPIPAPLPAAASVLGQGLIGLSLACLLVLGWLYFSNRMPRVHPAAMTVLLTLLVAGIVGPALLLKNREGPRIDRLTTDSEPFTLEVTNYFPVSTPPIYAPIPGPNGVPMIEAGMFIKPPVADMEIDLFDQIDDGTNTRRWMKAEGDRVKRSARDLGQVLFTFQYAGQPGMLEDFLDLPADPLQQDRIRIHYTDSSGQRRVFVWPEASREGTTLDLPDSNLKATYVAKKTAPIATLPNAEPLFEATGEPMLEFLEMTIQRGEDGEPIQYLACSSLPNLPSQPSDPEGTIRISYFAPPRLSDTVMQGRSAVVDILTTPDGKLHYRAINREGIGGKGSFEPGKRVELEPKTPMTFSFIVRSFLPSGVDHEVCEPAVLPPNRIQDGTPAALVRLTRGQGPERQTRETWITRRRPEHDLERVFRSPFDFTDTNADGRDDQTGHRPRFSTVRFDDGTAYRVALDCDRQPLGFEIELVDFEVETDPGTQQPAAYTSDVLLTDESRNIHAEPHRITMNVPMTWRDKTFYQSQYNRVLDPRGRETGQFMSIFSVRYDPVWCWGTIYAGCLLVVLGTFVQFYMRAGLFTDGGKREREQAERKAARREGRPVKPVPAAEPVATTSTHDIDL